MKVSELIKAIGALQNDANTQTFDLTTNEGYNSFKNTINELRNSDSSIFDLFGIDIDEWLDNVEALGDKLHKSNKENKDRKEIVKDAVKQMERKEVDHSEEFIKEDDENPKEVKQVFKRPSELLTIDQKMQLHKIVQAYIDTVIKPFNNGVLTNDQINDAYAGLYEYSAWVLNR